MRELAEALAGCRMVLALMGESDRLAVALSEAGIPTVPLLPDAESAATLRPFRRRFDGAVVDLEALPAAAHEAVVAAVREALLPGGMLAVRRDGRIQGERLPAEDLPEAPGYVVGAFADRLVGHSQVAELACGQGRLLDALALRGVAVHGVEQDPEQVAAARARGHEVTPGGIGELRAAAGDGFDAVCISEVVEDVPAHFFPGLLDSLRGALRPGGRLLIRASRRWLHGAMQGAANARGWQRAELTPLPRSANDEVLELFAQDAPAPEIDADDVFDPPLSTADLPIHAPLASPFDLERFERKITSQCGDDGVLAALFELLGTTDRSYVEFGCGDGVECNTRQLQLAGWSGVLMDGTVEPGAADVTIHQAWITAENINALLDQHGVPAEPDLMSIDLDGNDYWVWRAIERRPRVVVAEYNGNLAKDRALTMPYDPEHRWDGSDYYGASLLALEKLGREKGYTLVYCNQAGVNAYFVRDDVLPAGIERPDPLAIHRPANYWYRGGRSRVDLTRRMVEV